MRWVTSLLVFHFLVSAVLPVSADPLDERPDFFSVMFLPNSESWDAGKVVEWVGSSLEYLSYPVVVWVDPSVQGSEEFEISEEDSYRSELESFSILLGEYHEKTHSTFIELTWGSDENVEEVRNRMDQEVPPISFVVNDPSQLPEIWSRLSGIDISYKKSTSGSPGLAGSLGELEMFKSFEFHGRFREMAEEEKGMMWVFTVKKVTKIEEFMNLLAAQVECAAERLNGSWSFVSIAETQAGIESIRILLSEIKEAPYDHGYGNPGQTLVRIGKPATAEILKELVDAEDYYFNALVNILSNIPSPERDEAFLKELGEFFDATDLFLAHWYVPAMMKALADNKCRKAIPILQRFAAHRKLEGNLAGHAKIALSNLESPVEAGDPEERISFADESDEWESLPDYQKMRDILLSIVDLDLLFWEPGIFEVTKVKKNKVGGLTFKGKLPNEQGTWDLEIGKEERQKIPVYYSCHCGPRCGVGCAGVLEYRDNRWLVVFWQQLWVS